MERYPLRTLNRITLGLVGVSLVLAGWIAFQHLDHMPAPQQAGAPLHP